MLLFKSVSELKVLVYIIIAIIKKLIKNGILKNLFFLKYSLDARRAT